ncbi:MAG: AAA family ATPase [Nitrososphaerota archaeon]
MIEEVRLKNFLGYEYAEVRFTEGLNLITGRNSTGKTAILESILYGLYGAIPGIDQRLLFSKKKDARNLQVYIKFKSPRDSSIVEVYRTLEYRYGRAYTSSIRLFINSKEIPLESQEDLRRKITLLLGVGYRSFNWLVYIRQGKLTEIIEPKKEEMDTVFGITLLREICEQIEQAGRRLSKIDGLDVESEYRNLIMNVIPIYEERLKEVEEDLSSLSEELKQLEKEISIMESPTIQILINKISELEKYRNMNQEIKNTRRELLSKYGLESIDSVKREESRLKKELEDLAREIPLMEMELRRRLSESTSISSKILNLKELLENQMKLLQSGKATCPTCGQPISPLIIHSLIIDEENELKRLREEESRINVEISELEKKLEEKKQEERRVRERKERLSALVETFKELDEREMKIMKIIKMLENEVEGLANSLKIDIDLRGERLMEKVGRLIASREEVELKKAKKTELEQKLKEKMKLRYEIARKLEREKNRLREVEKRVKALSLSRKFLEKLTESIEEERKAMLESISYRSLQILDSLTDQKVYRAILIDPENYSVYVHPVGLIEPIPAVYVGGGHQTLISLALRLAILEYIGFRNLIILDEPTYGVDQENLEILLNYFSKLKKYMKQVILVTHHGYGVEEADNIIKVYKDSEGVSRVEQ